MAKRKAAAHKYKYKWQVGAKGLDYSPPTPLTFQTWLFCVFGGFFYFILKTDRGSVGRGFEKMTGPGPVGAVAQSLSVLDPGCQVLRKRY